MRRLHKRTTPEVPKAKEQMPLTETIQTDRRGRVWREMSDEELVKFAKRFVEEKGITGKKELQMADNGLHLALRRRKLLDRVGFEEKSRNWTSKSNDEIVDFTERFMAKRGITKRGELQKTDPGLYDVLRNRNLLDRIGFAGRRREWGSISDDEIVELARKVMKERGITKSKELEKTNLSVYHILQRRKLLDRVSFDERKRKWGSMSDDEIVELARTVMKERGITKKWELKKADPGLYTTLYKRKLTDRVGFENRYRKARAWASMSDDELVKFAKKLIEERGIEGTWGLQKVDAGLYQVL